MDVWRFLQKVSVLYLSGLTFFNNYLMIGLVALIK